MLAKNKVASEKMIELEEWLLENCSFGMDNEEFLNLLTTKNFSQDEIQYLIGAYYMPKADIRKKLNTYDTAPCMDELEFVSMLQEEYNCDRDAVIKRIRYIREINQYLKNNPNMIFSNVKFYDKLVRDNIIDIIESSGEKAVYHVASDEEYWAYLLKKDSEELEEVRCAGSREEIKEELGDKLAIIRAMASYHGFTLEDIIEEADLKKEKKGEFSKRIVLEKVYKYQKEQN